MPSFLSLPSRSRTLLILVMIQNHELNVYMNWPGLELFPLFLAKCSNNTKNSVVADNTYLCYWRRLIWTTTIPFASNLLSDINIRFHVIVAASCPNLPVCVCECFLLFEIGIEATGHNHSIVGFGLVWSLISVRTVFFMWFTDCIRSTLFWEWCALIN